MPAPATRRLLFRCRAPRALALAATLATALVGLACTPSAEGDPPAGPAAHTGSAAPSPGLEVTGRGVEVAAEVTAGAFERKVLGFGMPGYHLVVWDEGKAAPAALFRAKASDREVLEALEGLGLEPGNGLGMDTWEERDDRDSPAPERVIAGPPVEVLVRLREGEAPLRLEDILDDPGGRGFDMRFGGHEANIPKWHSGCVVCLYSCPGSKIGNARYTVRDYVDDATRFRVKPGVLPADGSEVTLIFRPRPAAPGAGS